MMDKSDDPTYNAFKLSLTWYSEHAIGRINYHKRHRVRWVKIGNETDFSEEYTFPNYKQACIYVRDFIDTKDPYTDEFSDYFKWKITDLHSWEVRNHDDYRNDRNDNGDDFYDEDEYEREFADAINKVLNSKAFTHGLGLKLSMRTKVKLLKTKIMQSMALAANKALNDLLSTLDVTKEADKSLHQDILNVSSGLTKFVTSTDVLIRKN